MFLILTTVAAAVSGTGLVHATLPKDKRGIRFVLKGEDADKLAKTPLPKLAAKNLCLYNAFNLVCEVSGLTYSFGKQQEIVIESLK